MNLPRLLRNAGALFGVLGLFLTLPASAQGQTGSVVGRVVDARSMAPVAAAQVVVVGTQIGGLTDAEGNYRILNVQPGTRQIRVISIGYSAATQEVTVLAGQTARVDFGLSISAVALDEIIVTGTAGRQDRRAQAASVATVNAAEINEVAPVNTVASLLQARTAGVSITQSSGTSGGTQRIRIRGSASLNLSNEPLLII
ncbi:MAG TPA: carboxypeptidase-like regulatory domain-containing protein, partial [Longimicrobiales bacterium]|nr:carboxypeptidase-like regulatory domain-containing protein [Longimicrobiales bacterium]